MLVKKNSNSELDSLNNESSVFIVLAIRTHCKYIADINNSRCINEYLLIDIKSTKNYQGHLFWSNALNFEVIDPRILGQFFSELKVLNQDEYISETFFIDKKNNFDEKVKVSILDKDIENLIFDIKNVYNMH